MMGVKGLHVADMSACRVTSDGGSMAMAYMTGHIAAVHMLRSQLTEQVAHGLESVDDRSGEQLDPEQALHLEALADLQGQEPER